MSKNKTGKYLKYAIGEIVLVVIGILIALLINNRKENLENERFMNDIISSITQELIENKKELKIKITEHYKLIDTIEFYLESKNTIGDILERTEGLKTVSIKNTAWKSIINQNIRLVDYEVISTLTDIEEGKQDLKIITDKMIDYVYENFESNEYRKKKTFWRIMKDFLIAEKKLFDSHQDFFKQEKTNH